MTNCLSPDPNDAALVRWATQQLGLDEAAPTATVRDVLRARLPQDEYLPALRRQQACQLLCRADRPKVLPPLALDDEETRLRAELDEFSQRFFQLDHATRRKQWAVLRRQCGFYPTLQARVEALQTGLDAPGTAELPTEPMARELAEHLQSLFTARRALQPAMRRALLKKLAPEIDRWSTLAWDFRAKEPALVALDTRLIQQLADWRQRQKLQAKGRRQRITIAPASSGSSTSSGDSSWIGGGQFAWLIVLLGLAVLRVLFSGSSSQRSNTPTFRYTPPTFNFLEPNWNDKDRLKLGELLAKRPIEHPQVKDWARRKLWEKNHPEWAAVRATRLIGLMSSSEGSIVGLAALSVDYDLPREVLNPRPAEPGGKLPPNQVHPQSDSP